MKWINVKERLPDIDSHVLVVWRDGFVSSTTFRGLEWNDITHWMPLPEPPEAEG